MPQSVSKYDRSKFSRVSWKAERPVIRIVIVIKLEVYKGEYVCDMNDIVYTKNLYSFVRFS